MAKFQDLPTELRTAIWDLCLPEQNAPGVYFYKEDDFKTRDDASDASVEWESEKEVLLGIPTIMHLCRESREYARSRLHLAEDPAPSAEVPYRAYRPETDVFFVRARDFEALADAMRVAADEEYRRNRISGGKRERTYFQNIAHLAVESAVLNDGSLCELEYHIPSMTALRKLSLVFGRALRQGQRPLPEAKVDEGKMCRLVPFPEEVGSFVGQRRKTKVRVKRVLEDLQMQSSLWEVDDDDMTSWDRNTGGWLWDLEAVELVRAPGRV